MSEFAYRISVVWSAEDEVYVASVPALDVLAHGDSPDEAVQEARVAAELMIESLAADQLRIPPPEGNKQFSGNIRLRIPKRLHQLLAECAQDEGVSLNTLMVTMLASGVGDRGSVGQARSGRSGSSTARQRRRALG